MTKETGSGVVRPTIFGRLRTYMFAGILVTAPIGITLYLTWVIVHFIDSKVMPLLPQKYNPETFLPFSIPGIGLIVMLIALTLIGWLTAGILGRWIIRFSEHLLARMPVVRNIYSAIKQIVETVMAQQSSAFREVVLIEYPRRGIWAVGFITGGTVGEVQNITDDKMVNIFLPTTPNPTSGFLLFVPEKDVYRLSMTVEEGIKMVISAGIVTPPDRRPSSDREKPVIHIEAEY